MCVVTHIFSSPVGVTRKESPRTFVSSPLFLCHLLCLSVQTPVCPSVSLSDCLCTRVLIVCVLVQCMEVHRAELQEERVSAGDSPQSA